MTANTPDRERTLQLSISKDVFNRLYDNIRHDLPPSLIGKPNCKYSTKTIMEYRGGGGGVSTFS